MIDSYVCIDLETSGLEPKKDRILEIGAIKVIDGMIVDQYETLVDAGVHLRQEVVLLTGISEEMTKSGKSIAKAITECVDFIGELPLLGHCIRFDYSFLKKAAVNHKLPFEKCAVDTLKIARKALDKLESRSLEALCAYYHIPRERSHRAIDDAMATHELYWKLRKDFGETFQEAFEPFPLIYQVKKESPATPRQKRYLKDLVKYHKIDLDKEIDSLTKNEASRYVDQIIFQFGRIDKP